MEIVGPLVGVERGELGYGFADCPRLEKVIDDDVGVGLGRLVKGAEAFDISLEAPDVEDRRRDRGLRLGAHRGQDPGRLGPGRSMPVEDLTGNFGPPHAQPPSAAWLPGREPDYCVNWLIPGPSG